MKKTRYCIEIVLFVALVFMILFYVKPVEVLGHSIKILFIHVPSAWIAVLSFLLGLYHSIRFLLTKNFFHFRMSYKMSLLGIILISIATLSGAIWAKMAWNSFWNGDVRQTTVVLLLLIYLAYFVINLSFDNKKTGARLSSVYLIFASFSVPLLIFIIPRLYDSLHPTIEKGSISMNSTVVQTLIASVVIFSLLFIELILYFRSITNEKE